MWKGLGWALDQPEALPHREYCFLESEAGCQGDTVASAAGHGQSLIAAPDKVAADVDAEVLVDAEIEAQLAVQVWEQPFGLALERQFVHIAGTASFHSQIERVAGVLCEREIPDIVCKERDGRHKTIRAIGIGIVPLFDPVATGAHAEEAFFIEAPAEGKVCHVMGIPVDAWEGAAFKVSLKMSFVLRRAGDSCSQQERDGQKTKENLIVFHDVIVFQVIDAQQLRMLRSMFIIYHFLPDWT